ncbi:tRNA (guanine(46)-N(7))-methyltransferase TrmB [Entomobacter blattae]|nr:tRNA (guanine(46)-N(7))-methyltransferase TrmB [Entomobacter blattae]
MDSHKKSFLSPLAGEENSSSPAERLYGRNKGHPLRKRQQWLLEHTLPLLRVDLETARKNPLHIFDPPSTSIWMEVGFGSGEHSLAQYKTHPEVGYIACEVFLNGVCSLLSQITENVQEHDILSSSLPKTLKLWDKDARILLDALPDETVEKFFLLFPDPWPKSRHAKRRFVHPDRIRRVARILQPGGIWRIASDDPTYQDWVKTVMKDQSLFELTFFSEHHPENWPKTRYEIKALKAGRKPLFWEYTKR